MGLTVRRSRSRIRRAREALTGDNLMKAVKAGAEPVRRAARRYVHVESGELQESIETFEKEAEDTRAVAGVGTGKHYARTEEFRVGGRRHPGNHAYLRPAMDHNRADVRRIIRDELRSRLRKATAGGPGKARSSSR